MSAKPDRVEFDEQTDTWTSYYPWGAVKSKDGGVLVRMICRANPSLLAKLVSVVRSEYPTASMSEDVNDCGDNIVVFAVPRGEPK